jgi:hypothetical protein
VSQHVVRRSRLGATTVLTDLEYASTVDDLLYARWQIGASLAFHILVAVIGMAMPVMMVAAEVAWLRTSRPDVYG